MDGVLTPSPPIRNKYLEVEVLRTPQIRNKYLKFLISSFHRITRVSNMVLKTYLDEFEIIKQKEIASSIRAP